MDPVEEFAWLRDEIRRLEDRAQVLRAGFLKRGTRLRTNRFEVVVRQQTRRVFQKDRLPAHILNDPQFWTETVSPLVTVRPLGGRPQGPHDGSSPEEGPVLIEPFDLPPPPVRPLAAPLSRASGG